MRRFRRLRGSEAMRRLVRETRISAEEMIYPIFVIEGENIKNPIPSMPGVFQYSVDRMDEMLAEVAASGIAGVLIFRDSQGKGCGRLAGVCSGWHHPESHSPYQKEVSLSACGCGCLPLRIYLAWALRLS